MLITQPVWNFPETLKKPVQLRPREVLHKFAEDVNKMKLMRVVFDCVVKDNNGDVTYTVWER